MSLNLNKISRPYKVRRNSFFDGPLPSQSLAFRQTQSILLGQEAVSDNFISTQIIIPAEQLQKCLKIYQWRNQNPHSIVKCIWTGIYPADQKQMIIETKHKNYCFTLNFLNKVSLTQCLYILTSVLPSFWELFTKFGSFNFSQQNIFFDQNLNCEVWINQNPSLNSFQKIQNSQQQIVLKIVKLLENHQLKSNIGKEFFSGIHEFKEISFSNLQNYVFDFIHKKQLVLKKNLIKENFIKKAQKNISSIQNIQTRNSNQNINQQQNQSYLSFSQKKTQRKRYSKILKESHSTAINAKDQSQQSSSNGQVLNFKSEQIALRKSENQSQDKMIKSLFTQQNDKKIANKNYYSHLNQKKFINDGNQLQNVQDADSQTHKQHHKMNLKLCPQICQLQINPQQQKIDRVSKSQMKQLFKMFEPQEKLKFNSKIQKKSDQNAYKININTKKQNRKSFQFKQKQNNDNQFLSLLSYLGDTDDQGFLRSTFSRIQETHSRIQQNQQENQISQKEVDKNQPILNKLEEYQHNNVNSVNIMSQNSENVDKIILPNIGNLINLQNFYNKTEMSSSITVPDYLGLCRKRSQSPIKLQKLGKLKMQTAQSIIQEGGFGYYDD